MRTLAVVVLLVLGSGCTALLGIESPAPSGAVGDADAAPAVPDFGFAIVPVSTTVPHDPGFNLVEVELTRVGGFDADVTVTVSKPAAGSGLAFEPLAIDGQDSTGGVRVHATGQLALGTEFTLELTATGGGKTRTASVPVVVTEPSGSLETAYGPDGTGLSTLVGTAPDGTSIHDMLLLPDGTVVLVGDGSSLGTSGRYIVFNADGSENQHGNFSYCSCTLPQTTLSAVRMSTSNFVFMTLAESSSGITTVLELRKPTFTTTDPIFGIDGQGKGTFAIVDPRALAVLPDDRLRVVAVIDGVASVVRLDPLGIPEDGFGTESKLSLGDLQLDKPATVRTSGVGGGFLWIAGAVATANGTRMRVVRLLGDGSFNPAWGVTGAATVPAPDGVDEVSRALIVLGDGRVLIAGTQDGKLIVRRLRSDGTLDTSFGDGGLARSTAPALAGAANPIDMDVQADGRILVLTSTHLARFRPDGSTDVTYGTEGAASLAFVPSASTEISALVIGKDGKALVSGAIAIGNSAAKAFVAKLWF